MTYKEIKDLINEYDDSTALGKSTKDLLKTIAMMSFEAGKAEGILQGAELARSLKEQSYDEVMMKR